MCASRRRIELVPFLLGFVLITRFLVVSETSRESFINENDFLLLLYTDLLHDIKFCHVCTLTSIKQLIGPVFQQGL